MPSKSKKTKEFEKPVISHKDGVTILQLAPDRALMADDPNQVLKREVDATLCKLAANVGEGNNGFRTLDLLNQLIGQPEEVTQIMQNGSGIPYYASTSGDILINPSTVDIRTFNKMVETDAVIGSSLDYNISSIVNSIGKYKHKNEEIEKTMQLVFKRMERGFDAFIKDICTGFAAGFSVLSFQWGYDEDIGGSIIKDAIPLPPSTIQFRADSQGYIKDNGVGQYVYNAGFQNIANANSWGFWGSPLGGSIPSLNGGGCDNYGNDNFLDGAASGGDLEYPYRIPYYSPVGLIWLNRKNVLLYSNYSNTARMNPYGKSILRRVYNLWLKKTALQQFEMVALNRRSFPLLLVYCNQLVPSVKQNATTGAVETTSVNMVDAAKEAFSNLNSLSTMVLPGMKGQIYEVDKVDVNGDIDVIQKIEDDINSQIRRAMGVPDTVTGGGDGASYALAAMHGQTNSRFVASRRQDILNCILTDFVRPQIEQLFPEYMHKKEWGSFEDEQISQDERLKNASLYQIGTTIGVLFNTRLEDVNMMREGLGADEVTEAELTEAIKAFQEMQAAQKIPDKRDVSDMQDSKPYAHSEGKV